ncbi:MAG: ATP-binding cassette domain-containing protein, partial [Rhodospirillales bacterium]|nr:ATP-binding cassette domain-containing protein [Rhodospirillales bacterium]
VELGYISISTRRVGEIFEAGELAFDPESPAPSGNDLRFEGVHFAYRGNEVLQGIDCHIPERALTALVGLSGSGKSTMTSLMSRFWEVGSGRILLGSVPLTTIDPDRLLTRFATVFQDVFLFNDTVANNIRVGKMDATMDEIMDAARKARCHDFIMALPNGYDTLVGERGNSISGGERQRISIARAILKDAPIIVLDEATASLDPENEAEIQKAFESLIAEKTVIAIAHQFAPIEHADQILVLNEGCIAERGSHEELLRQGGLYRRLWDMQRVARSWKMG